MMSERRARRFSTHIPVRWQVFDRRGRELDLGRLDAARARDLGPNGLFLSGVELPTGTRIHLFFPLGEGGACVEAWGEVVHGRPRLDAMGRELEGVGVRLLRMSGRDRALLDGYLADRHAIEAACTMAAAVRIRAESHRKSRLSRPAAN